MPRLLIVSDLIGDALDAPWRASHFIESLCLLFPRRFPRRFPRLPDAISFRQLASSYLNLSVALIPLRLM